MITYQEIKEEKELVIIFIKEYNKYLKEEYQTSIRKKFGILISELKYPLNRYILFDSLKKDLEITHISDNFLKEFNKINKEKYTKEEIIDFAKDQEEYMTHIIYKKEIYIIERKK
jgi:hypothetical protein